MDIYLTPSGGSRIQFDQNGEGANKTLLDAVYNYIMAPDNPADRLAPPNTILTVAAPDLVNIPLLRKRTERERPSGAA